MELKLVRYISSVQESVGSNRTFMELKFVNVGNVLIADSCSNRTFMELKYRYSCLDEGSETF